MKLVKDLEEHLPDEFKTVITNNTITAEQQFIKEVNLKNHVNGSGRQITKMHVTWGPKAKGMTVQQMVDYLWKIENAPKTEILPGELDL